MRAAIYVRLSRETDETTSPERQRAACEALCEARGWEVVAAEEDIDVSGFSRGLDRPGLQRILTRLAELDVIVFFKIDRLARSTVDFAEIMRLAEHQSVALASATEPLDLTSSMGRAMAKVIAVFAELESDTIGMRVSSAHEHLRREGRYTGGRVPYGYMVVPNPNGAGKVLAVNEDEAKTIKRIVERVLAKDSLMQIINDLNKAARLRRAARAGGHGPPPLLVSATAPAAPTRSARSNAEADSMSRKQPDQSEHQDQADNYQARPCRPTGPRFAAAGLHDRRQAHASGSRVGNAQAGIGARAVTMG
ncbi:recombinase family protein [Streptomyces echinatus]|uniref:recombinase family protein n=1 Tax=Streptomyces echinatus TaxID=67293 RepID=UPI0037A2E84D